MRRSALFVILVSDKVGITQKAAGETINAVLEGISSALEKGDSISLIGFGSFKVVERAAREGRNPRTGEQETTSISCGFI